MKIVYFALNNFRGISGGLESNKIHFKDTNTLFIFGQNNTGKSTFLLAYQNFYFDSMPKKEDFYKQDEENNIEIELEVELEELDNIRIETNAPKQKDSYKKYLIDDKNLKFKAIYKKNEKGKIVKKNCTWNPHSNDWDNIGYASIGLHTVFQSCMPKPIFIKAMPNEEEVKSVLNDILKSIAERQLKDEELAELLAAKEKIHELQEKMYKPEVIRKYEHSINVYFSKLFPDTNISITDTKSKLVWSENKLGKDFDIEFNKLLENGEIDTDIPVNIENIGHGTIRTAIFTLLLMRDIAEEFNRKPGRKDYIVLFEEPELFLFPKIIKELRSLIYQVSEDDLPYQILCASHSPQMIDISKTKSSLIRLVKESDSTKLYQINDIFLKEAKDLKNNVELRQAMYEVLRFNPFICESFYSDEILLVEGPTEEIIARAYLQEIEPEINIFVLNCGSVTNIPFYQKVFSKFSIKYNVICDTDGTDISNYDENGNPQFEKNIQGSISNQFHKDKAKDFPNTGLFRVHDTTFEPAHKSESIADYLKFEEKTNLGKPYNANLYWKEVLCPNITKDDINNVPIIKYIKNIIENEKRI
jgi:putative ATP-dependent endonuclease of the OLD family